MASRMFALIALWSFAGSTPARAERYPVDKLPPVLAPWADWVRHEVPDASCARFDGEAACLWPGRLALNVGATGGDFVLEVVADRALDVVLPGGVGAWPLDVRLDDRPAVVLASGGFPVVHVQPGAARLVGRLAWTSRPESLHVPEGVALVDLTVDGKRGEVRRRDQDRALLWLGAGGESHANEAAPAEDPEQDEGDPAAPESLALEVARWVVDGVPMQQKTHVVMRVSGKTREVGLGRVQLDGSVPLSLVSELPVRLDEKGETRVQLRAGTWTLDVVARFEGMPEALLLDERPEPWPADETWVWQADDGLRQVVVEGLRGIDPKRTSLPKGWPSLPTYSVKPGDTMALKTARRGEPSPPPDRVELIREAWLDLEGGGYTVQDHLTGTLSKGWRVNLEAPGQLGHVRLNGEPQLITIDPSAGDAAHGVEVRSGALDLLAESRYEGTSTLPAVGWSRDVQKLALTLHVPPGWDLLTVTGADDVSRKWLDAWNLGAVLLVLLGSAAAGRLLGWRWGAVSLCALGLCQSILDAPYTTWFGVLLATALLRYLPEGRLRQGARVAWLGSLLAFALVLVPFVALQVRVGLHPQARDSYRSRQFFNSGSLGEALQVAGQSVSGHRGVELSQVDLAAEASREANLAAAAAREEAAESGDADEIKEARYKKNVENVKKNTLIKFLVADDRGGGAGSVAQEGDVGQFIGSPKVAGVGGEGGYAKVGAKYTASKTAVGEAEAAAVRAEAKISMKIGGDLGDNLGTGQIDKASVSAVFKRRQGAIRHCYEKRLKVNTDLAGTIHLKFTIGPSGRATEVAVRENSTGDDELGTCISDRVREWPFPKPEGGPVTFVRTVALSRDSATPLVARQGQVLTTPTEDEPPAALQSDPNAVVQTGPGLPDWEWESWRLTWTGPVSRGHEVTPWLLGPLANLALRLVRAGLWLLLAGVVVVRFRRDLVPPAPPSAHRGAGGDSLATAFPVVTILLATALLQGSPVLAQELFVPSPETLGELRNRLTEPPGCVPACVSISRLDLDVRDAALTMAAEVHAGDHTAWLLPGGAENWSPRSVRVDGTATAALSLRESGFLAVRLSPGRHLVEAAGPLASPSLLTLEFPLSPQRVLVDAPGWRVEGLHADGTAESTVLFTREVARDPESESTAATAAATAAVEAPEPEPQVVDETSFPPWLSVTRTLEVGVPWLVHTRAKRVSSSGQPIMVKIPLLAGESITSSNVRSEAGKALVSLGQDDVEAAWSSTLDENTDAPLVLTAPANEPWSETWILRCSPIWQCVTSGLDPTRHQSGGRWEPTFRPWPGESVSIAFKRPAGAPGAGVTIDRAEVEATPGPRVTTMRLGLSVRTSQGGVQRLTLPESSRIQALTVDRQPAPIQQEGAALDVTLEPGSHVLLLEWQNDQEQGVFFQVPTLDLGADVANARIQIDLAPDRWVLLTGGPSWGPAILYWGMLLALVAFGLVLGRLPLSPLRSRQWALLAFGFSLIPVQAALAVAAWFFVLAWRRAHPLLERWTFDGVQVLLVGWTLLVLAALYSAVHLGFVSMPDMQVAGLGSTSEKLSWYADRVGSTLPAPWVVSLPAWVWKGVTLAWSLWLAINLLTWLRQAWTAWSAGGRWKPLPMPTRKRKEL